VSASIFDMFGFSLLYSGKNSIKHNQILMVISQRKRRWSTPEPIFWTSFLDVASFGRKTLFQITGCPRRYSQNSVTHLVTDELPFLCRRRTFVSSTDTTIIGKVGATRAGEVCRDCRMASADKITDPVQKSLIWQFPKAYRWKLTAELSLKSLCLDSDNGFHEKIFLRCVYRFYSVGWIVVKISLTRLSNVQERCEKWAYVIAG
jgi:hypothetical protein